MFLKRSLKSYVPVLGICLSVLAVSSPILQQDPTAPAQPGLSSPVAVPDDQSLSDSLRFQSLPPAWSPDDLSSPDCVPPRSPVMVITSADSLKGGGT